jgi:3-hydroxyacyl-CoA dehydrogenase
MAGSVMDVERKLAGPFEREGTVAVITLDNPPVNGLGHALRRRIVEGVDAAAADDSVKAIVLVGANGLFSGGADIREFNTPAASAEPTLHTVIRVVESCAKPVIAAISGHCMGGGLELSLACHYRVAVPDAQVGLPEVKIGLIPGAGGTQRLPRAAGVETALNMIVSGNAVAAAKLAQTALFDEIVAGDLREGAIAFAAKRADARPLKRVRDMPATHPDAEAFFAFARNAVNAAVKNLPAPAKCVEAVAASVSKPFEEGIKVERGLFLQLIQSPESRALRHAFFAERAAAKIADVPADTPTRDIRTVAIVGAGTMGGGIAMNFLNAGLPVTILETTEEALQRGIATIRRNYEASVKRGKLAADEVDKRMKLLWPTLLYDDLKDADLVIEAVFEQMDVKEKVFRKLDLAVKQGAILATNTSTLDVDRIASFTFRPQDVVGLHFFSPANVMKLLEVVRGAKTAKDVLATVMQLAKKIRKNAVVSGVCDGFIGNRMVEHYLRQALFLVEDGATPQQVDRALEKFGMAMGPFRMSDLAGLDIGWAIRKRRYVEKPQVPYSRVGDRLCEQGRFGQKTGAGWYRYESGKRDAIPDPAVEKIIADYRAEKGITPRKVSEEEIVERCIYALVNEGARILEEGIAARASDIDLVYLTGYGFPLHRGGPMLYADSVGLYNVVRAMRAFQKGTDAAFWEPAPLLAKLAREGKGFTQ